jgi:hypothetical protein
MPSDLVIASVTAVLKRLLENGLADRNVVANVGSDAAVSALAPDRVPIGETERPQLNRFLFQVTPFTSLAKGNGRPSGGEPRPASGPLVVELHYLLSAYGAQDLQAELLLGFALRLFHEHPVLGRDDIRRALADQSSSEGGRVVAPAYAALAKSSLPDSVERIRITPEFPSTEQLSRLWSALQAHFRASATYKVSAVFVDV